MVSREVEAEHLWVVSKRLASSAEESQYFVWFQYSCFTLLIQSSWKVSFHCNKNIPYVDWLQLPVPIGQLNYAFIGKWFHELNTQGVRELSKMTSTKRRGGAALHSANVSCQKMGRVPKNWCCQSLNRWHECRWDGLLQEMCYSSNETWTAAAVRALWWSLA